MFCNFFSQFKEKIKLEKEKLRLRELELRQEEQELSRKALAIDEKSSPSLEAACVKKDALNA